MISTGSAASGTSVMVRFPLAGPVDNLVHGTAYHWDQKLPERAGPITFEATHDFLIPQFGGKPLAAIFHAGVAAWAATRDGVIIGALWRNANQEQCEYYGAEGTDTHEVALSYAIRVPTGVADPRTGQQLREALAYETPLRAAVGQPAGNLPRFFSLASASPSSAILKAAKAGTEDDSALVLRVYQPTNQSLRVAVRGAARRRFPSHRRFVLQGMTALEAPLSRDRATSLDLTGQARRFSFLAHRALTTIAIRTQETP
jgi:alpha-mannosidase